MIAGDGLRAYMLRKIKKSKRVKWGLCIFRIGLKLKSYRIQAYGDKLKRSGMEDYC